MKSSFLRVSALLIAGLVVVAVSAPLGASGLSMPSPLAATASIDVHEVLSGAQQQFTVTVNQPATGRVTGAVNAVQIVPPGGQFRLLSPVDPAGWHGGVSTNADAVTYKADNGGIAGGSSVGFTFVADTLAQAADAIGQSWTVATSTNGGTSFTPASPSAAGALSTTIRTLDVLGITITSPAALVGESPLTITQNQAGIVAAVRVNNLASGAQNVAASLTGSGATAGPAQTTAVAPGAIATFLFDVTAGSAAGAGSLVADAAAGVSNAADESLPLTVQKALTASYVGGTLFPLDVVPGGNATFDLVAKPAGEVASVLTAASTFSFAGGAVTANLPADLAIDPTAGDAQVRFATITIPASVADGDYTDIAMHLVGADANGAAIDLVVPVAESVNVDSNLPLVTPVITNSAVTNGSVLTFGGTITDGPTAACSDCDIIWSALEAVDGSGAVVQEIPITDVVNSGGQLEGSTQVEEWDPEAVAVRLVVEAMDPSGLQSSGSSAPVDVDLIAPTIALAKTASHAANPDGKGGRVELTMSEPVGPSTSALDWNCDSGRGFVVTGTTLSSDGRTIALVINKDVPRDVTPTCSYSPINNRLQDRVALQLANVTVTAVDGVAPAKPAITAVDGKLPVGTTFFTNQSAPVVSIASINKHDLVEIWEDADGSNSLTAIDPKVGEADSGNVNTIDIPLSSLGGSDRTLKLLVRSSDAVGNTSPLRVQAVTLDFTAPVLSTATRGAGSPTIALTASEVLAGTGVANDWSAYGPTATTTHQRYVIGSVTVSGSSITASVNDPRFTSTTPLTSIRYEVFNTDGSGRLTDLAGNLLGDGEISIS